MTTRNEKSRKPNASRARKRRIAARDKHALSFETLESRRLLATVIVNATSGFNGDVSSIPALIANDGGDGISFYEATYAANNTPGADTITFDGSVFSGGAASVISGGFIFSEEVTIDGSTATDVTIDGSISFGDPFLSSSSVSQGTLTLSHLTISGGFNSFSGNGGGVYSEGNATLINTNVSGNGASGAYDARGGGIFARGNVNLTNSTVSNNSATGSGSYGYASGGGIFAGGNVFLTNSIVSGNRTYARSGSGGGIFSGGNVTLTDSSVDANRANGQVFADGGGIIASGSVTLINSTVKNNSTSSDSAAAGGISTSSGDVTLTNSTVEGNSVSGGTFVAEGGGILTSSGNVILTNSTVSGNRGGSSALFGGGGSTGGGIRTSSGDIFLENSTVSGNSLGDAGASGAGISSSSGGVSLVNSTITENYFSSSGEGSGIRVGSSSAAATLTIINSIVAGNETGFTTEIDIQNIPTENVIIQHSLIGSTRETGITTATGTGNILDTPALLGPLADNGGPTLTHAILPGSPAINAGNNALAVDANGIPLTNDQRGSGFDRIQFGTVDIGAFESDLSVPVPPTVVSTTINEGGVLGRPDLWNTLTVVFDSDVNIAADALSLFNESTGFVEVNLSGVGFSYDSSTNTAIWDFTTLVNPLEAAFFTYRLDASSITSGGLSLDGNGDGTGGDDFVGQHYVAIPGDANLDGVVNVLSDAFALVGNLNSTTELAWADGNFNGDGIVNVLGDAFILIGNLGQDVRPPVITDVFVNNVTDLVNGNTNSIAGLIANDGGDGISLREAVIASNGTFGAISNTIGFDESVFTGGSASVIRLTQGELVVSQGVTIDGTSGTEVLITADANDNDVTFDNSDITDVTASLNANALSLGDNSRLINFSGDGETLTLAGLTLTGGRTEEDLLAGGGIYTLNGDIQLLSLIHI